MNIRYKITFMPLRGTDALEVCVYDANYTSTPVELIGAADPFVTEEDDDEDFFLPRRTQTGYLNIVDDGTLIEGTTAFDWRNLLPEEFLNRPVVLRNANTHEVLWMGFIQHQQPDYVLYETPTVRSYAIYDVLGAADDIYFSTNITGLSENYINFAKILKIIIDNFPEEVRPSEFWFQGSSNASEKLLCKVNPQLFHNISGLTKEALDAYSALYTCGEVIDEICKFFGWTARTHADRLYFTQDFIPYSTTRTNYLKVTYEQLVQLAAGTQAGTVEQSPTAVTITGSKTASTDNNLHSLDIHNKVEVKADAGTHTDIAKLFPEKIRERLNGTLYQDEKYFVVSVGSQWDYTIDGHKYAAHQGCRWGGNIFGFPDSNGVKFKQYDYKMGPWLGLSTAQNNMGVEIAQLWPMCFKDCLLSMQANFYGLDGNELTTTDESYGPGVGAYTCLMSIQFNDDAGNTYWYNPSGARWIQQSTEIKFDAQVGGNGDITPVDKQRYKAIPLVDFYQFSAPVGRLTFRIYGLDSISAGMFNFSARVQREVPPTITPKDENTYGYGYYYNWSRGRGVSIIEWSAETIFASDNYNEVGFGTVLQGDNTPLITMLMPDGNRYRPEEWLANMAFSYYTRLRWVLNADMRDDLTIVKNITPAHRLIFKGMTTQPVSISRHWCDSLMTVKCMQVSTSGYVTYVVTPVAGTGISSVSGGGQVLSGDPSTVACEVSEGYIFSHWQDEEDNVVSYAQRYTIQAVRRNMTLTAVTVEDTRTFSVTIIRSSGITAVVGEGNYRIGEVVSISCTMEDGYTFRMWTENNPDGEVVSYSQSFDLTVRRNIVLYPYAEYTGGEKLYRLYFYIMQPDWGYITDDNGEIFHNGSEYQMIEDEVRSYTAVPAAGYEFVKWNLNGKTYSTDTQIYLSAGDDMEDMPVTAVFQKKQIATEYSLTLRAVARYTRITVEINNSSVNVYEFSDITKAEIITVPANAPVKLTASYNGFDVVSFNGWRDSLTPDELTTSNPLTLTMNRNTDITCVYS